MSELTQDARAVPATQPTLSEELLALYAEARADMGADDLAHVRHVADYAAAIRSRSRELLVHGGRESVRRGVILHALHTLVDFSELGHSIFHGCYDELPDCGDFHSERWNWHFLLDVEQYKANHHESHHPFTNIAGKDHDIGLAIGRFALGQTWFAHHSLQPVLATAGILVAPYLFPFIMAHSSAQLAGERFLSLKHLRPAARVSARHCLDNYVRLPLAARERVLHTLVGTFLGTTLGYAAFGFLFAIEHHADGTEMFHDPGPNEPLDDYYRRQAKATMNFIHSPRLNAYLQRILEEEVPFEDRPSFEIFYGGLDTHIEHHFFPDLPPDRQREIAPRVREILGRHGLAYNQMDISQAFQWYLKTSRIMWMPVGEREEGRVSSLIRRPAEVLRRLAFGAIYRELPDRPYSAKPRFYDVPVQVTGVRRHALGAVSIRLRRPEGWESVAWQAGDYVSLRVGVGDENLVRQYSLVRDSVDSDEFEICVKRVDGGRVSHHLNDRVRRGAFLTLIGPPTSSGGLTMPCLPDRTLFIAGGVGITPIISLLRRAVREDPGHDAVLLYFNRDRKSVLFADELRDLARASGLTLHFVHDHAPAGALSGRMSVALLDRLVPDLAQREVYACAPPAMLELTRTCFAQLGGTPDRFHVELFSAPALDRPATDGTQHSVRFRRSGAETKVDGATTLLEAARQAGLRPPAGCERGLCRACVTGKISGTTQHDEKAGVSVARVTICNSLPRSDIELDL